MSENTKCKKCKANLYDKVLEHYLSLRDSLDYNGGILKNFYYIFIKLLWDGDESKRVGPEEQDFIASLRHMGFSIGDVGFIVGRSKSTVHEVLVKAEKLARATQA